MGDLGEPEEVAMTYRILCCDGGGIRGLITALLIQDLNRNVAGFIDRAELFAGTSTGGLISIGLARGVSIDDIIAVYKTKGSEIFTPNGWTLEQIERQRTLGPLSAEELMTGPGVVDCEYKSDGLQRVAAELLGDGQLSDCKKTVVVNAARLWDGTSWQAATMSNLKSNSFRDIAMVDAALATAAAPTYFPAHEVKPFGYFADGGVFANNPAMTAIAEVLGSGADLAIGDLRVLSLGTGDNPQGIPPATIGDPLKWGASYWLWPWQSGDTPAMPLISLIFACTSGSVTAEAQKLLGDAFRRADVPLAKPYPLDDWKNVAELEDLTHAYLKTSEWQKTLEWASDHWTTASG